MTTFAEKIAALPEWPEDLTGYPPPDDAEWNDYLHAKIGCTLARLALAREWIIERGHDRDCSVRTTTEGSCDCDSGRLLKALEGPK